MWELGGCLVSPTAILEAGLPVFFAHYEEDQGDLRCASLVPQQFSPSHVAACPQNSGIWLLDVINCTGETLSNALSHLYHFSVTLYMSVLQQARQGDWVLWCSLCAKQISISCSSSGIRSDSH